MRITGAYKKLGANGFEMVLEGDNTAIDNILSNIGLSYPCEIEIRRKRKKRSLNANNYSWVLTDQLADKLGIAKDECHRLMLERYGQTAIDSQGNKIIMVVFNTVTEEDLSKVFGYVSYINEDKTSGRKSFRVLKGSSAFDTKEMSIFIEGIISECKEQGIETLTPNELARLKSNWKGI